MKRYLIAALVTMVIEHIVLLVLLAPDESTFIQNWQHFEIMSVVVAFILIGPMVALERPE